MNTQVVSLSDGPVSREFEIVYETHSAQIKRALALAIGDVGLAHEAADEAWTRAFSKWDRVAAYDRPEGWVYRVALNWARDVFRRRRYELVSEFEPEMLLVDPQVIDLDLVAAVGRLSDRLRAVVVARYYLDWSTAEVAAALDLPEGTVKSRLSRALNQLERALGEPR